MQDAKKVDGVTLPKRPLNQLAPMPVPRPKDSDNLFVRVSKRTLRNHIIPAVDWALKVVAALFIVGTSLKFIVDWLHANRINHDFSLAAGILVMSIAIYLIVRKR